MPNKKIEIPFDELPPKVQHALRAIMQHRREINLNARFFVPATFAAGVIGYTYGSATTGFIAGSGYGYLSLIAHEPRFRRDYLLLARALQAERNNPLIQKLLAQPHANFVYPTSRGSLATKRFAPKAFYIPYGRRSIPNPTHKERFSRYLSKLKRLHRAREQTPRRKTGLH